MIASPAKVLKQKKIQYQQLKQKKACIPTCKPFRFRRLTRIKLGEERNPEKSLALSSPSPAIQGDPDSRIGLSTHLNW
jgi:hypothetical protein